MERKVGYTFTKLEYGTLLSIIKNIKIGLIDLYEQYDLHDNIKKSVFDCIDFIKMAEYQLCRLSKTKTYIINLDEKVKALIEKIFTIEYSLRPLIIDIWQNAITSISEFGKSDQYMLLVHMLRDNDSLEYIDYITSNQDIGCISTSLISNNNHKHFSSETSLYGFVYEINDKNFLGAIEADGQVEQTTNDSNHVNLQNFQTLKSGEKHSVNSIIYTGNMNYQVVLTKTPYTLLNPKTINEKTRPFYNEVVLDKQFSKPVAVIYYDSLYISDEVIEKARILASRYKIPLVKIDLEKKRIK